MRRRLAASRRNGSWRLAIAVAAFQKAPGECEYQGIQVTGGGTRLAIGP